jgi:hypothetical protein
MQVLLSDLSLMNTKPFLQWGLSNTGTRFTDSTGYYGLPLGQRTIMLARLGLPPPNDIVVPLVTPTTSPVVGPTSPAAPPSAPVSPPIKAPTKQPVKPPGAPVVPGLPSTVRVPSRPSTKAPVGQPEHKCCGVLGLSLFCPLKCGFVRRLLGLC